MCLKKSLLLSTNTQLWEGSHFLMLPSTNLADFLNDVFLHLQEPTSVHGALRLWKSNLKICSVWVIWGHDEDDQRESLSAQLTSGLGWMFSRRKTSVPLTGNKLCWESHTWGLWRGSPASSSCRSGVCGHRSYYRLGGKEKYSPGLALRHHESE